MPSPDPNIKLQLFANINVLKFLDILFKTNFSLMTSNHTGSHTKWSTPSYMLPCGSTNSTWAPHVPVSCTFNGLQWYRNLKWVQPSLPVPLYIPFLLVPTLFPVQSAWQKMHGQETKVDDIISVIICCCLASTSRLISGGGHTDIGSSTHMYSH